MTLAEWYQGGITCLLFLILCNAIRNLHDFRQLASYSSFAEPDPPFVSILVPARNEEANIERCVHSLLGQDYPVFELIVLDDNSTDHTGEILKSLARDNRRLRVIQGAPLPAGWVGKNFAYHQLAQAARGSLLLFTDADTCHQAGTLSKSVAALEGKQADLMSLIPYEEVQTLSERMIVPFIHFAVLCLLPLRRIWDDPNPLFSFSTGQFIFVRRSAYEAIGGHAAIPGELVEDVMLGRQIKRHGLKLLLLDGVSTVSCRMYHGLREVWSGFAKSIFAAFHFHVEPLVLVVTIANLLFLAPFLLVFIFLLRGEGSGLAFWLVVAQVALVLVSRSLLARRFRYSQWDVLLHPLALIHLDAVIFYSTLQHTSGIGATWKGRRYHTEETPLEVPSRSSEEEALVELRSRRSGKR